MNVPSLLAVSRKELLSPTSVVWIIFLAVLYIALTLFLLNDRLVIATVTNSSPIVSKTLLLVTLFGGLVTAFSPLDTAIVSISALLVGINLLLISRTVRALGTQGKLRVSIGGATLIGIISTGCSSCGFSVLSILGLSTSLSFLPFHGLELHAISVAFLFFSAWYMLKKLRDSIYCKR